MIALLQAKTAGLWSRTQIWNNVLAGLVVGIFAIEEIITDFKRHGAAVLLVEVRPNVRYKLERGGVIALVGPDNVIDTLEQALRRARELRAIAQP
jgi:MFS superfamily sulfate permease-like transporter